MTLKTPAPLPALCRERVVSVDREGKPPVCVLANRVKMRVSAMLAGNIGIGDEISFRIPAAEEVGGEVYVTSAVSCARRHDIYQAPIGYVNQPKLDKRGEYFVSAEVRESGFGISAVLLPCRAVRDYFYRLLVSCPRNK